MVTSSALAVFLLEGFKSFVAWATKNPAFDFSPKAMAGLLVVFNALSVLLLAVLNVEGYVLPTDWTAWVQTLVASVLGALVSSAMYVTGMKPFKDYSARFYGATGKSKKAK